MKLLIGIFLILSNVSLWGQGFPKGHYVQRHLGWVIQGTEMAPVILSEGASSASVQVTLARRINNIASEVHGWVVAKDDTWAALDASDVYVNSGQILILSIKQNAISNMSAIVFRLGHDFYSFTIKPRTDGLSDQAQFLFDQLNSIPAEELVEYETDDKILDEINPVTKVRILNVKKQLIEMNVKIHWDPDKRQYSLAQ